MGIDAEMYVDVPRKVTPEEVLKVSRQLVDCLGPEVFWLRDEFSDYMNAKPAEGQTMPHALYVVSEESQDSADEDEARVQPQPGHTFVKVSLGSRYYGKGYERGPFADHIAVRNFLKHHYPDGKVFYGGDSSGVLFEEMTDAWVKKELAHFHTVGHAPYRGGFDSGTMDRYDKVPVGRPKPCPRCLTPLIKNGWGADFGAFFCNSCDLQLETRDGGKTFQNRREKSHKAMTTLMAKLEAMGDKELMKLWSDAHSML